MDYELQILLSLFWKEVVYLGLGNIICYKVKKKKVLFANILVLIYSYLWSMDPYVFKSWHFFTLLLFWPFLVLFIWKAILFEIYE